MLTSLNEPPVKLAINFNATTLKFAKKFSHPLSQLFRFGNKYVADYEQI